ncbi:MAG: outer membrane protein assembly factor BamA [Sedimentisphaerales bacterium]
MKTIWCDVFVFVACVVIFTQPAARSAGVNDSNLTQPASLADANDSNLTQPARSADANDSNLAQPANSVDANDSNSTQPASLADANDSNLAQPASSTDANDSNLTQPVGSADANDSNLTQPAPSAAPPIRPRLDAESRREGEVSPSANVNDSNQVISAIRVEGNVSVKEQDVLAKIRTRQDDVFNSTIAAEDVKRIAEIKGVEYCYYNTKAVDGKTELTFVVVERNLIRSISFTGNKAFKDKKLIEKLGFKVGDYLDPVLAHTYATTILEFYRQSGFPYTEVSLDTEKLSTGKLIYNIKEGPRVKIDDVKFSGNKHLGSRELKQAIKARTRTWLVLQKYYNEDELAEDVSKLQRAYQKKGFLNAKIEAQRQFNADKSKVRITFAIEEGVAYSVENTIFTGNQEYDNKKLYGQMTLLNGQIYNEQMAENDTKQITKQYRENGFIDAKVERGIKFVSDKTVAIEYTIKEGERFRIGQITITGNEQTKDKVIRRVLDEYDFQPGKWYNGDIARGDGKGELEKNLQQTVLTERDGATITPSGSTPGQKDAQVSIIEGKTGMVMLGAGVSSDSGIMGQLTYEQRNFDIGDRPKSLGDFASGKAFKGGGQTLRISLQPGTELSTYSISFTEPYLNDKPISLDVVGSSWQRWRESYNEDRLKGFVGLDKREKDKWHENIGIRAEKVNISNVDNHAPKEIKEVKGDNSLYGARVGAGRDLTDNKFNPSKGQNFDFSYEQVTGDYTFGILNGTYRKYFTLYEDLAERKTVLATKLLGATTLGDAPPFEKFYAGGTGTYGIRGFQYRGVSTRGLQTNIQPWRLPERRDPIGSNWIILANAEATVPLIGDNIALLLFVDSGKIDTGGFRVGAGTGLQIMLPQWFGPVPMRFELASPLMKSDGDKTQVFSFSVGTLF